MVTPDTSVLQIGGVDIDVKDVLAVLKEDESLRMLVRMKALERMVADRDAELAALPPDGIEVEEEVAEEEAK